MLQHAYYESKKYALIYGSIIIVPLIIGTLYFAKIEHLDWAWVLGGLLICIIIFSLFILLYPVSHLEIYVDHVVYRQGNKVINVRWSEVKTIAFLIGSRGATRYLYMDTVQGKTGLMDTRTFLIKGDEDRKLDHRLLVDEIEGMSGRSILVGYYVSDHYSQGTYKDYTKGRY